MENSGEEKVKDGERKRGELMGEKLIKRGILLGKREGNSTPSPTWKFGLIQADGTLFQDFNFSTINSSNTLSARKLGANLWEMQPQINNPKAPKMSKNVPNLNEARANSPSKQPTSSINVRKQHAESLMQHNLRVKKAGEAQQPLSPSSYCSSMEMPPHRPATIPNTSFVSNGKSGESSHRLKTSTELLKVLNRIWSLEEKHALDMSLVKTLRRELDQSQTQIQELLREKERDHNEIENLMKRVMEYKVARKREQDRIKGAVKLVENKLEDDLKLRRRSEKRNNKLAKEFSEMKSSFSNALRELEWERKARKLLEDLCDEFAKEIREYEQEVRSMKQKSFKDQTTGNEENDRFILHISEAWLDERAQMKLADDGHDISDKLSALDKLCAEIEAFLRAKHYGKSPLESNQILARSLESLHFNEPASAPWKANNEDEYSVSIGNGKSRTENLCETNNNPRMPRKGEMMQRSYREGRNRVIDAGVDLQDRRTRHLSLASEDKKLRCENYCMEGSFDPSTFTGPSSPVKKWTSEVLAADHEIDESSSRWEKSIKPNTLKAKLMEARLERQQSRARTSKGLSQVE